MINLSVSYTNIEFLRTLCHKCHLWSLANPSAHQLLKALVDQSATEVLTGCIEAENESVILQISKCKKTEGNGLNCSICTQVKAFSLLNVQALRVSIASIVNCLIV
jgi:hypothetical protein